MEKRAVKTVRFDDIRWDEEAVLFIGREHGAGIFASMPAHSSSFRHAVHCLKPVGDGMTREININPEAEMVIEWLD